MISVNIIADSISTFGFRLTSFELFYPRIILAELNTHRVFSRNTQSSRAVPVKKIIQMVRETPVIPHWTRNQPGMTGLKADSQLIEDATKVWLEAAESAVFHAERLLNLGVAKQNANRLLEPFVHVRTLVTTTNLDNFLRLRIHPDAQPEMKLLAENMLHAFERSTPQTVVPSSHSGHFDCHTQWHLPYITEQEKEEYTLNDLIAASVARCARISYTAFDGTSSVTEDMKLYLRLTEHNPPHSSPLEHVAAPDTFSYTKGTWFNPKLHGNFTGWMQFRQFFDKQGVGLFTK